MDPEEAKPPLFASMLGIPWQCQQLQFLFEPELTPFKNELFSNEVIMFSKGPKKRILYFDYADWHQW